MFAHAAGGVTRKRGAVASARRADPPLATRMAGACAVLALFVGGVFAVEQVAVSSLRGATRALARSRDVGRASLALEAVVLNLENGLRGYVITGNPALLRPWLQARVALSGKLAVLERSVSADPAQRARFGSTPPRPTASSRAAATASACPRDSLLGTSCAVPWSTA